MPAPLCGGQEAVGSLGDVRREDDAPGKIAVDDLREIVVGAPAPWVHARRFGLAVEIDDGPMFGLHNRDWPSIWAASRLCELTLTGPIELDRFLEVVTTGAWSLVDEIQRLARSSSRRYTALLPTNRDKPDAAAEGFRSFAIGGL